jgi:hypothetical protein
MKNKFVQEDLLKLKELCKKDEVITPRKSLCASPMSQNPFKKEKEGIDSELEKKFEKFAKIESPEKSPIKVEKENKKPVTVAKFL